MDRWTVRSVAMAAVIAAGFSYGAHMATGAPAEAAPALAAAPSAAPVREAHLERDALRGSFWRPAGSLAERPDAHLSERSSWQPAASAPTELAERE